MGTKYIVTHNGDLYHWGIKGMKWGERRYQNKDGSLTAAGIKRYYKSADREGYKNTERTGERYKTDKKGKKTYYEADVSKWVDNDLQNTGKVLNDSANLARNLKTATDKIGKNKPRERLDLSNMSDKELREQINRELLERQYNDVFNPPKVNKGKETASRILETSGDLLVVAGSAVTLALGIRKLIKGGD